MRIEYIGPFGAVLVPEIRRESVMKGEVLEADEPLGLRLLQQEGNWRRAPEPAPTEIDVTDVGDEED